MRIKSLVAFIALFVAPIIGFSQESNLGNWMIYIGSKNINSKWNVHHEIQYRNYNAIGDLEQLLLRTGMGYNITDKANLLLGYGFINSQNYLDNTEEKVSVDEHRIFQQFITKQVLGSVSIQHRYRFEQRFVEDDFKVRYRYFLSLNIPISSKSMTLDDTFYASIYNEIFLNSQNDMFDRNRLYTGLGYKLNSKTKFELGYMNQFLNGSNRDQINMIVFHNF